MPKLPKKLENEPLIEAIFEIRFACNKTGVAKLLPGIISSKLQDKYQNIKDLPTSNFPPQLLELDKNLRYIPVLRMEEENTLALQLGDRVVSIHSLRPYVGWDIFFTEIQDICNILEKSKLIDNIERISLKYIDIFEKQHLPSEQLDLSTDFNFTVKMSDRNIFKENIQLITSEVIDELVHTIQLNYPVKAKLNTEKTPIEGVFLCIEITNDKNITWDNLATDINNIHSAMKEKFFSLITEKTINTMKPNYSGGKKL